MVFLWPNPNKTKKITSDLVKNFRKKPSLLITNPFVQKLNGFLSVDKPQDYTSNDVIQKAKWNILDAIEPDHEKRKSIFKELKVGHGGTLDPIATGILVLGFGEACKKFEFYLKGNKEYRAVGLLGTSYDTEDVRGKILDNKPWEHVTLDSLKTVIKSQFTGLIYQKPPAYSAISVNGTRLYKLARKGKEIPDIPARPITIFEIEIIKFELPRFEIRVVCSGGTYIRTLIKDICEKLGTVGAMESLVRTRQGNFKLNEALSLDDTKDYDKIVKNLTSL